MAWVWTTIALFAAAAAASLFLQVHSAVKKKKKLAPGPRALPILGHLHLLGKNPHRDLSKLAKLHGPIMRLRFGFIEHVVVSSPPAAHLFLNTHDLLFAGRPPHQASNHINYGQINLTFGQYGPYWRAIRKICTLELLSSHKIKSFQSVRTEEMCLLVQSLKSAAAEVDLSARVAALAADMSCRTVFGKKYEFKDIDERGLKVAVKETMELFARPNLADFFPPYLGWLDLQGFTRRLKATAGVFDTFLERILDDHEQLKGESGDEKRTKDFVDIFLSISKSGETDFHFSRQHVKSILLDMFVTSMDTSATVIEWTVCEIIKHPQVMKKVQQELESKVGLDRMVDESDLENLKYLEMVIKESLRLHPVAPLLLPHEAREDCVVDGFHIPKGARIMVNVWAIGRDPNVWPDPEKFIPERFEGLNIDYKGQHYELIPFGSGRRMCPGLQLGITVVRLVVAQLVHCFDWELSKSMSPAEELDMTEEFGLVLTRASHLMVVPKYRLCI
ncbi:unnamed protein product [Cuscuta europaea]|uniref:Cytochrome P450 n=1 Tax=Cuscuta europaea TaxID=41803 RepID=A0A9P0ZRR5_CUSEU|nr:unnamed protein product [Cuscuta europaea]